MERLKIPRLHLCLALWGVLLVADPAPALILPPEGFALNRIHAQFEWTPVGGALAYRLEIVVDDQGPDPFASATPVFDQFVPPQPRWVVTSGLEFGESYAWRVSGVPYGPGPTHRFQVVPLPVDFPEITVTPGNGPMEPGLTLFNVRAPGMVASDLAIAVDASGAPVWFLTGGEGVDDLRLLPNGRMLYTTGAANGGQIFEVTLSGQVAWVSPDAPDLVAHHEAFPMPNGNVLTPVFVYEDVLRDGEVQTWKGDRYVEIDRSTNQVVWEWNVFDHFSVLDFDETVMSGNQNVYNWTHSNGVIYDPATNSVVISVRHLSRVTRIDYASGNIVYQMGFDQPSGETDFGDDFFSFQHAPEILPGGHMLIYDNGNRRGHVNHTPATGTTRVVEVAFDAEPPTDASIVWTHPLPDYTPFVGDADRLANGNTLITAGPETTLYEVDASGNEVWRLELSDPFPTYLIYRADRIPSLIVDAPADADGDGIVDDLDTCPDHANPDQLDCDGDGFGDVCAQALGLRVCDLPPCADGVDNDGDGWIDHPADPGCRNDHPTSLEDPQCQDGVDNDGDLLLDYGSDPGCSAPWGVYESPACNDGIDNDGDQAADFPADPGCDSAADISELSSPCGLGFELALLLPAGLALRTRRVQVS